MHFFFTKKEVLQKMYEGGQMVDFVEGPPGVFTGTALPTVNQVSLLYICCTTQTISCGEYASAGRHNC